MIEFKRTHAIAAVFIAAVLVYANSLWNGFAYDDLWIILRNDRVHQLTDLRRIWLTPYWPSFGTQLGLYRPFAIFAFAVEWAISGGAPWFFHLVNVLLHAVVSVLAFLLIERLMSTRAAFAGALIFAIHPVHTEAVANVVGQNELWAALGVLGACLIYVNRPPGVALDWRRSLAIFALFAMALLAKESAVVLPGLLVLLDFVQGRATWSKGAEVNGNGGDLESRPPLHSATLPQYMRAIVPIVIGFSALLIGYLALRHSVLGNLAGTDAAPGLPHLREEHRVLNALRAWPEFIRLSFFPLDLSVDYSPAMILPVESFSPMIVLGLFLVVGMVLLMLATPIAPRAGLAAGWFVISLLPVSNFFFPIGVLIAERTLYMPSLAACFLAGWAWEAIARAEVPQRTRRLATVVALFFVVFFSGRTIVRNPDWDSLLTVWKSLIRDHPESYRAQWLNALSAWNSGNMELTEKYFQLAERIWSRDSQMLAEFANFYIGQREWAKAISYLERARDMTPFVPRTHELLAYAYMQSGRLDDALATANHATTLENSHPALTYAIIAGVHEQRGEYDKAIAAWNLVVKDRFGDMWLNYAMLARAQAYQGQKAEALKNAQVAATKARNNATIVQTANRLQQAIRSGCYDKRPAGACDALRTWQIGVTSPVTPAR